jgi:hypothetical protein
MRGNPVTRATTPDGRWAYTLYDGNGRPFVHALDTSRLRARCIDVPGLPANLGLSSARLRLSGHRLAIVFGGTAVAAIDTASLSVVRTGLAHRPRSAAAGAAPGTIGVALPIAGAVALLTAALALVRRRVGPFGRRAPAR